ncbi:MAG: glycosyltransferase family 39 protein, partial [Verrucomicrobiae bacterium]|nr:glycosyltransferase family 39 protein [Verrucomicrobiae bacterium]
GSVAFHPASWERSLFYSVNGNNHVVHTIGARFGLAVWRIFSGSGPDTFSEAAARMEPLLSGLLTLAALAFWLRSIGYPAAGAGAAWILALHPWHARYSAEARGYSALLLFVVLAVLCLTFALRTRRWRWWLGYGASQCLYLLCFAGAVYVAVGMNLLVAAFLLWKRDGVAIRRWLVACVLGAMVFLQMMTATVLRIWRWVQAPHVEPFPIDRGFGRDFWAHLAIGAPWSNDDPVLHRFTSLSRLAGESAFFDAGLKFVLPALLIAGIGLALARGGRDSRLFFGSLLLAAVLVFIHNRLFNMAYYTWYAIWAVVAFAAALALLPEILSRGKNRLAIGLVAAVVVFYGALSRPALARMRLHDRHPMRRAVVAVRGEAPALEARHAALLTGTAGSGANQVRTYDPRVRWVKTVADLDALVAEARRSGKPLVIYACGLGQMARATPDLLARLRDPALFTPDPDPILGLEEFWSFRLFRLNPEKPAP